MKQKVAEYIAENYSPGSRPDPRTFRSRVVNGEIRECRAVIKEGGQWYVVISTSTGNTRADKILANL